MKKRTRQVSTLTRLEEQLESGVKTQKGTLDIKVPLTPKDVKRISGEITKLKSKI